MKKYFIVLMALSLFSVNVIAATNMDICPITGKPILRGGIHSTTSNYYHVMKRQQQRVADTNGKVAISH